MHRGPFSDDHSIYNTSVTRLVTVHSFDCYYDYCGMLSHFSEKLTVYIPTSTLILYTLNAQITHKLEYSADRDIL